MTPDWRWNFEDDGRHGSEAQRAGTRIPTPPPPNPPGPSRAVQIRRRRLAAGALLLALAALAIALASGSPNAHRATVPASRRPAAVRPGAPVVPEPARGLAAVRSVLAYTPFVKAGGARGRDIALTFDDGPGPYTLELVKVLERYGVKATFFEIGEMLRYFRAATVRQIRDGDVIGDHTETHPPLATLSAHDQYEEIFEQLARIELAGGSRPVLFRPPYGSFDATTMRQLAKLHLLMVLWSVDTGDYLEPGAGVIAERAIAAAKPGAIILMHDGGGNRSETIAALPRIITGLRAKGFKLVTVPELLAEDPPPAGLPLPPNLSGD